MTFQTVSADGEAFDADLMEIVRDYESRYFSEVTPISSVEFVDSLDGPARTFPQIDKIEISRAVSTFINLCRFLVLHELINNKLFKIHGKRLEYDSPEFQNELRRLWDAGAYSDLL